MTVHPVPARSDFPADFRWGVSTSSFQIEGAGRDGLVRLLIGTGVLATVLAAFVVVVLIARSRPTVQ